MSKLPLACMIAAALGVAVSAPPARAHEGHGHALAVPASAVPTYARTIAHYAVPDTALVDSNGRTVRLAEVLRGDTPVMLNFIFTSCSAICPVMAATFGQVQARLAHEKVPVSLVSISIDPEYDTPRRLNEYAGRFGASPRWRFLTGTADNSLAVQRAFDVFRGDKMAHDPVTFMRTRDDGPWLRLDGFATAAQIIAEYHRLLEQGTAPAPSLTHAH